MSDIERQKRRIAATYVLRDIPPTETVIYIPKRKHTHPTSPRKAKP